MFPSVCYIPDWFAASDCEAIRVLYLCHSVVFPLWGLDFFKHQIHSFIALTRTFERAKWVCECWGLAWTSWWSVRFLPIEKWNHQQLEGTENKRIKNRFPKWNGFHDCQLQRKNKYALTWFGSLVVIMCLFTYSPVQMGNMINVTADNIFFE